jgi:hypothetical protein
MQPDPASIAFLHQCTGNQLKILLALKLLNANAEIRQIAAVANLNRDTTSAGLAALAVLGYTESADRYHWRLTSTCIQLPLWTPAQLAAPARAANNSRDAENLRIPPGSSSSLTPRSIEETTTSLDAENVRIPPTPPVAALMAISVSRAQAENAIARANRAGLTVTRDHVAAWQRYTRDRPSINNPGAFICARLGAGQTAPSNLHQSPEHSTAEERKAHYVPTGYEDIVQH